MHILFTQSRLTFIAYASVLTLSLAVTAEMYADNKGKPEWTL